MTQESRSPICGPHPPARARTTVPATSRSARALLVVLAWCIGIWPLRRALRRVLGYQTVSEARSPLASSAKQQAISATMDLDEIVGQVFVQLVGMSAGPPWCDDWLVTYARLARTCKRWCRLAKSDEAWRAACEKRWRLQLCEDEYLEAAQTAAAEAVTAHVASEVRTTYLEHYRKRESELIDTWPVFYMGGQLQPATPIGLHFFEPRYRLLIQKAVERDHKVRCACAARARCSDSLLTCQTCTASERRLRS